MEMIHNKNMPRAWAPDRHCAMRYGVDATSRAFLLRLKTWPARRRKKSRRRGGGVWGSGLGCVERKCVASLTGRFCSFAAAAHVPPVPRDFSASLHKSSSYGVSTWPEKFRFGFSHLLLNDMLGNVKTRVWTRRQSPLGRTRTMRARELKRPWTSPAQREMSAGDSDLRSAAAVSPAEGRKFERFFIALSKNPVSPHFLIGCSPEVSRFKKW